MSEIIHEILCFWGWRKYSWDQIPFLASFEIFSVNFHSFILDDYESNLFIYSRAIKFWLNKGEAVLFVMEWNFSFSLFYDRKDILRQKGIWFLIFYLNNWNREKEECINILRQKGIWFLIFYLNNWNREKEECISLLFTLIDFIC